MREHVDKPDFTLAAYSICIQAKSGDTGINIVDHFITDLYILSSSRHAQTQSCQNRIGFHAQNAVHLTGHGKPAVITGSHDAARAVGKSAAIDQNIVGDPAVLRKASFL